MKVMIIVRIEDLKIFVDVVRYHSMNIAAEKNFTTPQNLSKIIKRMEDELGVVLFKRSKKGSILTEKGEKYFERVLEVLHSYDDATVAIRPCNQGIDSSMDKSISIICTCGALSGAVMNAYNTLLNSGKNIILEINEVNYADIEKMINSIETYQYDIVACCVPQDYFQLFSNRLLNYDLKKIIFDEIVLVVSKKNTLSSRKIITLKELENIKLISFYGTDLISGGIDNIHYSIITNSHSKALEQIENSDSYGMFMFKKYCEINSEDFSSTGKFSMIFLDWKIFAVYLLMINKKKKTDTIIKMYLETVDKCLEA